MINPSPTWIISDAGTIYTSEEFMEFAQRSGVGLLTAPAEAHHIMGPEEGCIGILKNAVRRLLKEEQSLTVDQAFALAVHAHNNTINSTGFSPFQWVRGGSCPQENLLPGLDPKKAFGGVLRLKEKARIAYEQEHAKQRLSRLNNSLVRRPMTCRPGELVMLWRQRGKGQWHGPVRVLLQEGGTLWLASGASLIKARTNQVRKCSKREELDASVSGASVFKNPVTLETLLKDFTGKHFTNITGETPSRSHMERNLGGADVVQAPRPDKVRRVGGQGVKRKEMAEEADDEKENAEDEKREDAEKKKEERGADRVDGITNPSEGTGNQCPARGCLLPGGHRGPHEDEAGQRFNWSPYQGRIPLDEDEMEREESSDGSSSSSEELAMNPQKRQREEQGTDDQE